PAPLRPVLLRARGRPRARAGPAAGGSLPPARRRLDRPRLPAGRRGDVHRPPRALPARAEGGDGLRPDRPRGETNEWTPVTPPQAIPAFMTIVSATAWQSAQR